MRRSSAHHRAASLELAKNGFRTVIWDRPNCGDSDISFDGVNESRLNANALAGLLRALDMPPALVIGGSAGQDASWMFFHPIRDQIASLEEDVRTVRSHPLIPDSVAVGGFLYDVDTGLLDQKF